MRDLAARPQRNSYWDGILREGEISMLVGRAMAGKSTFACALTRALTLGISLLGRECIKAKVGYMALERNGVKVAQLLESWDLNVVCFLDELPMRPLPDLAKFLGSEISKHGLNVVIVDHLQNLVKVKDSKDYSLVSSALEPLQQLAKRTGAHVLLLHHQGKTDREGVIDVMGSEAYRAAADVLIEAKARDRRYFIRAEVRGGADLPRTRVTVNLATGEVEDIDATQAETDDAIAKVKDYFEGQTEPLDADAIQHALELNRSVVRSALEFGAEESRVFTRTGSGKRGDPFLFSASCFPFPICRRNSRNRN